MAPPAGTTPLQCSTVRRYWSYIVVVRAKPFTIQRGERLVVGVQPKADDRALDGSTFTTLHSLRPTYIRHILRENEKIIDV